MNQNTEEYLQQVIKEDNIQNSLNELRTKIEEQLFREHILSCLFILTNVKPRRSRRGCKFAKPWFGINN